jgi:hypothetical protein
MNLSRNGKKYSSLAITTALLAVPVVALAGFADNIRSGIETTANPAGLNQTPELPVIIGNVINVTISFVGIILLGYFLYAGFLWMTSDGKGAGVQRAKDMMKNAVIGLVIVVSAYAISQFVMDMIIGNVLSSS